MTHLVVGACSNRGRALSLALARTGHRLVLADRAGETLDALVEEVTALGAEVRGVAYGQDDDWAERLLAEQGAAPDAIIVAIEGQATASTELSLAEWEAGFDAMARRPWQLAKAGAQTGFDGRLVMLCGHAASHDPALGSIAFLIRTLPADTSFAANLIVGDDLDELAALVVAILSLPGRLLHGQVLTAGGPADVAARVQTEASALRPTRSPRRVIVTGGGGEIARALCEALTRQPADQPLCVLLVDRDAERLEATAAVLAGQGMEVETLSGDLADAALPALAVERAIAKFGGVDAVFSHAGVGLGAPALEISQADFDLSFAVNLRAAWLLAKASKAELAANAGSFIATGSIGALRPRLAPSVYSASKAALMLLVEQLAVAWGPIGIRVNAVSPGSTLTPMNRLWKGDAAQRAEAVAQYPLRRMADPAEIGAAMAFLAGPEASYVSGHNLVVDGALSRPGQ